MSFAGFEITTSKRGRPLRPALVKMLRSAKAQGRVRARLTSQFDGMIDGSRQCDVEVSLDVIADFAAEGGQTFGVYETRGMLHVYDACCSYDLSDVVEEDRRNAMLTELPTLVGGMATNGYVTFDSAERATTERRRHLLQKTGIDFDEAVDQLRDVSDALQLLAICSGLHCYHPVTEQEAAE